MGEAPIVSIIMPVKNAGKYIEECLRAIQCQTFSFWELIAVIDHSTDQSEEIIKAFQLEDQRIQLFQNKAKGIIPALQLALKQAKGQYITRMDADDIMPKDRLKLMMEAMHSAAQKTVVTGKVKYFSESEVSDGYLDYQNWLNDRIDQQDHWQWIYRECVIASPNWMVRKEDLNLSNLEYPEDYDLVFDWYARGFKIETLAATTLLWHEHPARTSRNSENYQQEAFFKLKLKHFLSLDYTEKPLVLWGTGVKGKLAASILLANNIDFIWMDLKTGTQTVNDNHLPIHKFTKIEQMSEFQLLIAVYPSEEEMQSLTNYLTSLKLTHGKHYWFL